MQSIPSSRRSLQLSCLAAVAVIATVSARAQTTFTWDGEGTDNNFSTKENWVGDSNLPGGANVDLIFGAPLTPNTRLTPNNDRANLRVHDLTFDGAKAFVIGGNQFEMQGGATNPATNNTTLLQTVNNNLLLQNILDVNTASGDIALNGVLSGGNELRKLGSERLVLSNGSSVHGSGPGGVSLRALGGTVEFAASTTLGAGVVASGPAGIGFINLGAVTIQADSVNRSLANPVNILGDIVVGGTGNVSLTLGNASGPANGINLNGASRTITVSDAQRSLVFAGVVANGSLVKNGAGSLTLQATNIYTGTTTVAGGTLVLGASNVIADASNVTLSGGTLRQANFSDTAGTLNVSASSIIDMSGTGSLTFAGTSGLWSGALQIWNWDNGLWDSGTSEFLRFDSLAGFTPNQGYSSIQFYSDSGVTPVGTAGGFVYSGSGTTYYLTAVPEPSAVGGLFALLAPMAWRSRRSWMRCRSAVAAARVA